MLFVELGLSWATRAAVGAEVLHASLALSAAFGAVARHVAKRVPTLAMKKIWPKKNGGS
jgi:hypothetical protein